MLLDRSRRSDRYLEWKVRAFSVGAVLGLAGIYFNDRWMTGVAIGVLALGMLMRLLPDARAGEADELEDEGDEGADEDDGDPEGPDAA